MECPDCGHEADQSDFEEDEDEGYICPECDNEFDEAI